MNSATAIFGRANSAWIGDTMIWKAMTVQAGTKYSASSTPFKQLSRQFLITQFLIIPRPPLHPATRSFGGFQTC
ncbi:hypothetical protein SSBR45R_28760 [Bradyrhizobium sp. SSBR45R]|nr:hypothetical protein SSBR45R_28760 [Bradyrhizobium sp. SSBR45R]